MYDDFALFVDISEYVVARNGFTAGSDNIIAFGLVTFENVGGFAIYFFGNDDFLVVLFFLIGLLVGVVFITEGISQITHEDVFVFPLE